MKLNLQSFVLIIPVAFAWLGVSGNLHLVMASLIVMAGAEALRQYFSASLLRKEVSPRQLFFFGVIYKNSENFFLNRDNSKFFDIKNNRKLFLFVGIYILSLGMRFFPAFDDIDFIYSAFFSLIISLWVYCGTYRQVSWVMLTQLVGTSLAFATADDANSGGFLIWLIASLWVQLQLHTWQLSEEARENPNDIELLSSLNTGFKTLGLAVVLVVCVRVADFFIPEFEGDASSVQSADLNELNNILAVAGHGADKKPAAPSKFIQKAAQFKLQAGALDFSKLKKGDLKLPSFSLGAGAGKRSSPFFSFGENRTGLKDMWNTLTGNKPVDSNDLDKLRDLAKKIKVKGAGGGAGGSEPAGGNLSDGDSADKALEDRIEKLKALNKQMNLNEDDMAAYIRARKEIADEVEKLMQMDNANSLLKEQLNLEKLWEKFINGLKKFSLLIILTVLLGWWLSRKAAIKNSENDEDVKDTVLPKEVRIKLKSLYKLLLKGRFTPKEEVLKSYYLLEMAFKEFEFARGEDLPPMVFLEKVKSALPHVSKPAETPIELFCQVFYGDKNPVESQIKELRTCMQQLMKKLLVI